MLDLLLVSVTYFLILVLIRRSQAAVLLRGVLILALVAVAVSALFQLPTFTYMLRAALIICLIAMPLIFQPELRRGLERLGRTFGFLQIRPTELVHRVVPTLLRSASDLSDHRTGGLIVLEGTANLTDVINTGVQLNADVSSDLLEAIFQDKGPLHDGAVIIREDQIIAAATVLPLSEAPLPAGMPPVRRKPTTSWDGAGVSRSVSHPTEWSSRRSQHSRKRVPTGTTPARTAPRGRQRCSTHDSTPKNASSN